VGRWTREEHLNFIKGLELHGKGWKKIAALIKTRTVVQIRTHAQKYFLKLQKARNESNGKVQNESKMKDGSRKVFNT
jgi:SHAQKYF class myb-like DNA-binding protein